MAESPQPSDPWDRPGCRRRPTCWEGRGWISSTRLPARKRGRRPARRARPWGTAERPLRTLFHGGKSGGRRARMSAVVAGFPGLAPGRLGSGAQAGRGRGPSEASHLGEAEASDAQHLFLCAVGCKGLLPTFGLQGLGEGTPESKWGSHHCFSLPQEFSGHVVQILNFLAPLLPFTSPPGETFFSPLKSESKALSLSLGFKTTKGHNQATLFQIQQTAKKRIKKK